MASVGSCKFNGGEDTWVAKPQRGPPIAGQVEASALDIGQVWIEECLVEATVAKEEMGLRFNNLLVI